MNMNSETLDKNMRNAMNNIMHKHNVIEIGKNNKYHVLPNAQMIHDAHGKHLGMHNKDQNVKSFRQLGDQIDK